MPCTIQPMTLVLYPFLTTILLASSSSLSSSAASSSGFVLHSSPLKSLSCCSASTTFLSLVPSDTRHNERYKHKKYYVQQPNFASSSKERRDNEDNALSGWDAFKDNIYNVIDILTLAATPPPLVVQSQSRGGGSIHDMHQSSRQSLLEQENEEEKEEITCNSGYHFDYSSKDTLETNNYKRKTTNPQHPSSTLRSIQSKEHNVAAAAAAAATTTKNELHKQHFYHEIKESIYTFIDNVKGTYTLIVKLPQHVEHSVQHTVSTVQAFDEEMKRIMLDIQNIPNNVGSFVQNVEQKLEKIDESRKQIVVHVQNIPDNIRIFQQNIDRKLEESQRHGGEFIQKVQSIPSEIQAFGQWIENAMENMKGNIPSVVKNTTTLQVAATGNHHDAKKSNLKRYDSLPRTIADIDPKLDIEVTEALRIANDVLASEFKAKGQQQQNDDDDYDTFKS